MNNGKDPDGYYYDPVFGWKKNPSYKKPSKFALFILKPIQNFLWNHPILKAYIDLLFILAIPVFCWLCYRYYDGNDINIYYAGISTFGLVWCVCFEYKKPYYLDSAFLEHVQEDILKNKCPWIKLPRRRWNYWPYPLSLVFRYYLMKEQTLRTLNVLKENNLTRDLRMELDRRLVRMYNPESPSLIARIIGNIIAFSIFCALVLFLIGWLVRLVTWLRA